MLNKMISDHSNIDFFKSKMEGVSKTVPYQVTIDQNDTIERKNVELEVSDFLSKKLIKVSKDKNVNIYKLFLAGLSISLLKYNLIQDVLITTSTFNFDDFECKNEIELLFFKLKIEAGATVKNVLGTIHEELSDNLDIQGEVYLSIKEDIEIWNRFKNINTGTGLFFNAINDWSGSLDTVSCLFKLLRENNQIKLSVDYNSCMYTEKQIVLFATHVLEATKLLMNDFGQKIESLNFIIEEDRKLIFNHFNQTKVHYNPTPVITQFETLVKTIPDTIAVKSGDTVLTYKELNEKANSLANYLLEECHLKAQEKVALMVKRSEKVIIGILGVLKAGGVYIPIDLSTPKERLDFFIKDSQCAIVLTEDNFIPENTNNTPVFVAIEKSSSSNINNTGVHIDKEELVYIIYTSGTTGRPKGAMVYHYSLTNHVNWFKRQFEITSKDSTMLINSYSFDGCYSYIWAVLTSGAALHIPNEQFFDPDNTLEYIKKEKITFLKLVPSTFDVLINSRTFNTDDKACQSIRIIKQGGETINVKNLKKYFKAYPQVILGNHYGATECTIGSVAHWITKDSIDQFAKLPILGKPFDNQSLYVLDCNNKLLPVGVYGEICIGGDGVGNGYYNNEDLTTKKFIKNPFGTSKKIYKTGDKGRWLPSGDLEFAGRLDNQIKIRGFRVELDEISEVAKEHVLVTNAIALKYTDEYQEELALWFTANTKLTKTDIDQFLKLKLPKYMLPAYYVQLDRIPLTSNGKINKKLLPNPKVSQLKDKRELVAPKNETETEILNIWNTIIGIADISITDNFFEIGGHSLSAIQLVSKIHKQFSIKLPLRDVFIHSTLEKLSELIISKKAVRQLDVFKDIKPIPSQEYYQLSHSQKRMWIMHELQDDKTIYNIPHALKLCGDINLKAFSKAFDLLIEKHEILRTTFKTVEGEPKQIIEPISNFKLDYRELHTLRNSQTIARDIAKEEASRIFDLEAKPPLSVCLLKTGTQEYVLLFTLHHIISDGWSTKVFTHEVLSNYGALCIDPYYSFEPLRIQYKDFAAWQNELLDTSDNNLDRDYWKDRFSEEVSILELPIDTPRTKERSYNGATKTIMFDETLSRKLEVYIQNNDVTLFMVLMATVKVLLYRYTGQKVLIVGAPVAGRYHVDLIDQIGLYVNTLAIKSELNSDLSFTEVVAQIKNNLLEGYQHQVYPFDKLIEDLNFVPEEGRSPLFDVMVSMQNNAKEREAHFEENNLYYKEYESSYSSSKFDITFGFSEEKEGINLEIEYSTELFNSSKIENILVHFQNILKFCISKPSLKIGDVHYLSETELSLISSFNGTYDPEFQFKSILEEFAYQVEKVPSNIALVDEHSKYTYKELDEKSNAIAYQLQLKYGVCSGDIVGVICNRNALNVASTLAVLKAGAAYLPLELETPVDRIEALVLDVETKLIITDSKVLIETLKPKIQFCFFSNLSIVDPIAANIKIKNDDITAESLAYIMFTSGTTGKPKGVMISHKGIVRLVKNNNFCVINSEDKILQTGALSFDAATFEIWGAILNGAELHILDRTILIDDRNFENLLKGRNINKLFLTTAWFNQLVDLNVHIFSSLEQLIFGGEKLALDRVKKLREYCTQLKLIQAYGPTENTAYSICGIIKNDDDLGRIPLGVPISHSTVYILDENKKTMPIGIPGEIYLGGAGLSLGYINDPESTNKNFVKSPFAKEQFLYKSGDFGRWSQDGTVYFEGRKDNQLKIRGYRIEIDEVVSQIGKHELVEEVSVVSKVINEGEKILVGYYTSKKQLNSSALKKYIKTKLPNYMVPSFLICLDIMPLNTNGKIDEKKLPIPKASDLLLEEYKSPESETEYGLVKIFSDLLKIDKLHISCNANFFNLGGHSLKATLLAGQIAKEFEVDVSIKTIFLIDTLKDLGAHIDAASKSSFEPLSKIITKPFYPVSPAQFRMYTLYKLAPLSLAYNVLSTVQLPKEYTVSKIKKACTQIINRHDSFRTSFDIIEGKIVQKIHSEFEVEIQLFKTGSIEAIEAQFVKPFNLHEGLLIRIGLKKEKTHQVLLLDMHHIITDGLSQSVLERELSHILSGEALEPVKYQYKDYVAWTHLPNQKQAFDKQETYWLDKFRSNSPELVLPLDYKRPKIKNNKGNTAMFKLSKKQLQFFKDLSETATTTLYVNMLSIWGILLSKLSGEEDITIGSPISGRKHPDVMDIVGMFVNTLIIRVYPKGEDSFLGYLNALKTTVYNDFENQDYPFEKLVEKIWITREVSRNPVFDTMFHLVNKDIFNFESKISEDEITFESKPSGVKFDLNFKVIDLENSIICHLDYNSSLFKEETIRDFIAKFVQIIEVLCRDKNILLSEISLLSEKEELELLVKVNDTDRHFKNQNKTLDQLFEENIFRFPTKNAVTDSEGSFTFSELNSKANFLASLIVENTAVTNKMVGILLPQSKDVIIAILGIFKAGCAYIPIDINLPAERINYILKDSGLSCIIATDTLINTISFEGVYIDVTQLKLKGDSSNFTKTRNSSNNPAYVIYTSGTTGKPKGVEIKQYQLVNYVNWFTETLKYTAADNSILLSSYAFDLGYSSIFPCLANGGTLHILKKEEYLDVAFMENYLNEHNISVIKTTPTHFSLLINDRTSNQTSFLTLRYVMLGGEALNINDLDLFFKLYPDKKMMNHYGPTEATIGCIVKPIDAYNFQAYKNKPVIGQPISNMKVFILDSYLNPVSKGAIGQIYVSGVAVASGYYKRPELTKEKFIVKLSLSKDVLYATGDLGSWTSNNEIVFKGRIDNQVKIRGFRVELGEVKAEIDAIKEVQKSAVLIKEESSGEQILVAYIEGVEQHKIPIIRKYLLKLLPSYMVPARLISIAQIPMTLNGKTDYTILKNKSLGEFITEKGELASNNIENDLIEIWETILRVKVQDINSNFFNLGGHSLKALQVISEVAKKWHIKIPLRLFFENPSIKSLSKYINESDREDYDEITKAPEALFYPLSHAQRRLWLNHQFSKTKIAYNVPRAYVLNGILDKGALEKAFDETVKRHEILRTVFKIKEGDPCQIILPFETLPSYFEYKKVNLDEEQLKELTAKIINAPFNLKTGPLIKVKLYQISEDKFLLIINLHHIITDGWSSRILMEEVGLRYDAYFKKEHLQLSPLSIQYKDYAVWEHKNRKKDALFEVHKAYWNEKFSGDLVKTTLPYTYPRSVKNKNEGRSLNHLITGGLVDKLEVEALKRHSSLYMLLLTTFNVLMYRYTGIKDIVIGTISAGREKLELKDQLGFYISTTARRTIISNEDSFYELLEQTKNNFFESQEHISYPFDALLADLNIQTEDGTSPLFDIMYVHQDNENSEDYTLLLGDVRLTELEEGLNESKFDVSLVTSKIDGDLQLYIEYNASLYSEPFLREMLSNFENILRSIVLNAEQSIDTIKMLGESEQDVLYQCCMPFSKKEYTTMHANFEKSVKQYAQNTALINGDFKLSYEALNIQANKMAWWLLENYSISKDTIIGFCLERSEWQIISMLAILKAGAAFLPIDKDQPEKRKEYICSDANPIVVITNDKQSPFYNSVVALSEVKTTIVQHSTNTPKQNVNSSDLAYIIYTSGSTGKPNGVMIEHQGNINMISDQISQLEITSTDRCLQFASISFDASIYEIFIGLYAGSTIVLVDETIISNPSIFTNYIAKHQVSFATLPPIYLSNLDKSKLGTLRVLVTAGEAPNLTDALFLSKSLNYYNAYGPTEYSVCATLYKVKGTEKRIPIGKPISNTNVYILDQLLHLVPNGVWGDIYLEGHGMARNYINREQLNAERFIKNPFNEDSRLYKTGDIGRWLDDGNIEYNGRSDNMFKIRGNRVEVGEIEYAINEHKYVKETVVFYDKKKEVLRAYIVALQDFDLKGLALFLNQRLPSYMVPNFFNSISKIPLTINGKVNYKLLTDTVNSDVLVKEIILPKNKFEVAVLKLWSDTLKIEKKNISTDDNFFDLGGQSILAMQLIAEIWDVYEKDISLVGFLREPTIIAISQEIENEVSPKNRLLALNKLSETGKSMFMIPPVLGSSTVFRGLAKQLESYAIKCYGIQYKGFDYEEDFDSSIKVMAESTIKEIRPYISTKVTVNILGYSMGVLIAAEVASILEKKEYTINLILIDKDSQDPFSEMRIKDIKDVNDDIVKDIIDEHTKGIKFQKRQKERIYNLVCHNIKILNGYQFNTPLKSNILALEVKETNKKNKMFSWKKITKGKFVHTVVKGNHFNVLSDGHYSTLTKIINKFINKNIS